MTQHPRHQTPPLQNPPVQNPCVLIPTYNNCRTLEQVVRESVEHAPVIVVDDGSTDATAAILAGLATEMNRVTVVTHPQNRGKGRALVTGFEHALAAGFTHAITIDSDGQHLPEDIPRFLDAIPEHPKALLLGARDLIAAGAGRGSRFGCAVSNFWTWVETGHRLPDTQTGFRCYPLDTICELALDRSSYDFEIEVMVKASWTGVPLESVPIQVRYFEGEDRVSHMRPVVEFLRISWLNTRLCTQRCCFPKPYLAQRSQRQFQSLSFFERLRESFRELFIREPGTPGRVAASVGLGLFMGLTPLWGLQIALTIVLSHLLGLSKTIAVVASNISFPLTIPPILYGSLVLGRLALGYEDLGDETQVAHWPSLEVSTADFWPWVLGSFLLAAITAVVGSITTYVLIKSFKRAGATQPG